MNPNRSFTDAHAVAGQWPRCLLLFAALVGALLPGVAAAGSSSQGPAIELWTRADGDHSKGPLLRQRLVSYVFDANDLQERVTVDAQYDDTKRRYRGVPLALLIERYGPQGSDLALLHFQNGMVIPLPLQSTTVQEADIFLAESIWDQDLGESGGWRRTFPPIEKRDTGLRDRRPLQFDGNKLVLKSPAHPMVFTKRSALFSPWLHADSLSGIEFADSTAYYRQFQVATSAAANGGYAVFLGRCQFCHGARNVGASYGWDLVEPVPLASYRSPESLFLHVRYRDGLAPERGLMMPAFKDLGPKDAKALWTWIKELGERPLAPYDPLLNRPGVPR